MKSLLCLFLLSVLAATPLASQSHPDNLLQQYLLLALKRNPKIAASRANVDAASTQSAIVGTLPDPMLSYSRWLAPVETRSGPQENILSLGQRVPFPGKLGLKSDIAQFSATAQAAAHQGLRRDIIAGVKKTYTDLHRLDATRKILQQFRQSLTQFEESATAQYASGSGPQTSILMSQVEGNEVASQLLNLEIERQQVAAQFNILLGRPAQEAVPEIEDFPALPELVSSPSLADSALQMRQELQSARHMLQGAASGVALARKQWLPDISLQANWVTVGETALAPMNSGKDAFSLMLGLNLPLWQKPRKAGLEKARAVKTVRLRLITDLENKIKIEIASLKAQLALAHSSLALYKDALLPQAEQSRESALSAYRSGQIAFLSVLDTERKLVRLRIAEVRERSKAARLAFELERAAGGPTSLLRQPIIEVDHE